MEVVGWQELKLEATEGVGDRLNESTGLDGSRNERGEVDVKLRESGIGVDTPRALASLARRCGDKGIFGGRHVGDAAKVWELATSLPFRGWLDMLVYMFPSFCNLQSGTSFVCSGMYKHLETEVGH